MKINCFSLTEAACQVRCFGVEDANLHGRFAKFISNLRTGAVKAGDILFGSFGVFGRSFFTNLPDCRVNTQSFSAWP